MSDKIYLLILKTGVYASLLSVFLVFTNLLFPFITSKQISFNILIEILFVIWATFLVKYPNYRPKWSYISFGLVAFFLALTLSSFTGVDFNLSFWGDIERMLGVFHLLHFLVFYFIIITVMRKWDDWKWFFIVSTLFAIIVSLKGLGEDTKTYSTIGNTAYVSGYLIFNFYFCLLLFFKEKASSLKWLYLLPLPIYFLEFNKANTTGALVGLGFSLIVLFFLYGILAENKKIKLATLSLFVFLAVFSGLALTYKDSDFIRKNSLLAPIAGIDVGKNTFQTRLISWKAAIKDFKNHPKLGTGHGNYAITFDKYFTADFYNFTRSETYFDRAHNNVIDIASTSGALGLITYLSIFFATAYYLIRGYIKKYFNVHEFVLISSLIIAYFVQNLAVFDSLVTYMGIMMTLALVYWFYQEGEDSIVDDAKEIVANKAKRMTSSGVDNKETYTLLGVGVIVFIIMWNYNILPLKMLVGTIEGQKAWAQGRAEDTVEIYKDALSYNTVLDRDSRTSLIRIFASNPNAYNKFPASDRLEVANYIIDLAQKNVDYNPGDSLNQMMLAQVCDTASKLVEVGGDKFNYYNDRAMDAINASIGASPGRAPVYFQKAQIYLSAGNSEKAVETLKEAVALNEEYYDSSCHLGRTLIYLGQTEEGYEYIGKCIDMGGASLLSPSGLVKSYASHFNEEGDTERVIKLFDRLVKLNPKDTSVRIDLAKLYAANGQKEEAIETAIEILEIDPTVESYVNEFIDSLE